MSICRAGIFVAMGLALFAGTPPAPLPAPAPKPFVSVPVEFCGVRARVIFHYNPGPHPERVKYLFDENPATSFQFPPKPNEGRAPYLELEFEEPQTLEGFIIRPGCQKSLKAFDASHKPGLLDFSEAEPLRGDSIAGGIRIYYDSKLITRRVADPVEPYLEEICRPLPTLKNMSERIFFLASPWPDVKRLFLSMSPFESRHGPLQGQGFADWKKRPFIDASECMPILAGHPTRNPLQNDVIGFLRKVRDHRYGDIQGNPPEKMDPKLLADLQGKREISPNKISKDHPYYLNYFKYYWRTLIWKTIRIEYSEAKGLSGSRRPVGIARIFGDTINNHNRYPEIAIAPGGIVVYANNATGDIEYPELF